MRRLILDPGTPPHGALSEALLFYAARADHLDAVIRPALVAGKVVISDRFSDSTRVYQGAAGGLDPKAIDTLEKLVVGFDAPNVTLILDVPADFGLARARVRGSSAKKRIALRRASCNFTPPCVTAFASWPTLNPAAAL